MVKQLLAGTAVLLSVGVAAQTFPSGGQSPLPVYRAPVPTVAPGISGALYEWRRLRQSDAHGFGEYARFLGANRGWPGEDQLRRRAEASLARSAASPIEVLAFLRVHAPLTPLGHARHAEALAATGALAPAQAAARAAWTTGLANPAEESRLLARFGPQLAPADHDARLDALLGDRAVAAAQRGLGYASAARRPVFEARIALQQQAADASARVAALGSAGANDPGLLVDRARHLRNTGGELSARALLAQPRALARPPADAESWLEMHVVLARQAAADRQWSTAYAIASAVSATYPAGTDVSLKSFDERDEFTNLSWLGGWTALHQLNRPADAVPMFVSYARAARSPQTQTKGLYWAGRAASAAGDLTLANTHWAEAARNVDQFYGQLSRERLGQPPATAPAVSVATITPVDEAAFERRPLVQAARALGTQGQWRDQSLFLKALAQDVSTDKDRELAGRLALRIGRPDLGVLVGREARNDGAQLYHRLAYPTVSVPASAQANWTLVHAIARQESQFDRQAESPVGARGLMQLMPGTAREQAGKMGLPYDGSRLFSDTGYNMQLGSGYFDRIRGQWGGNLVLAIASYNAGPGNARKWVNANGDPRLPGADVVKWIEQIPIFETRNYVQRVLENAIVYDTLNPRRGVVRPDQLSLYLGKNRPG